MNGYLQYKFECGSGPATLVTAAKVNDGEWHEVTLERTSKSDFTNSLLSNRIIMRDVCYLLIVNLVVYLMCSQLFNYMVYQRYTVNLTFPNLGS